MQSICAIVLCLLGTILLVQGSADIKQSYVVEVRHVQSWKVVTNTEYLEDPGPYNVYGTKVAEDTERPQQRWFMNVFDSVLSFNRQAGQYLNTFCTYKPCPDCFAADEYWTTHSVTPDNGTVLLISTWTDLCLTNPGNDYLTKELCRVDDERQIWKVVPV